MWVYQDIETVETSKVSIVNKFEINLIVILFKVHSGYDRNLIRWYHSQRLILLNRGRGGEWWDGKVIPPSM